MLWQVKIAARRFARYQCVMNKGHRLGDVVRETCGPQVTASIGVVPGIELEGSESAGFKVLRRGRSGVTCSGLQYRDDAILAGQGRSGLPRE